MVRTVWRFLNKNSHYIFGAGVVLSARANHQQWQRDVAAKLHPQPLTTLNCYPLVSVLVAAWNESHIIQQHIQAFLNLSYPNKQLILCAGGRDDTLELAQQYADGGSVIVIEQEPGKGKQAALRKALPYATGEIVYLTDADCLLNDDAFIRTIAPIANGEYDVVNGSSKPLTTQHKHPFVMYQWTVDYYANLHAPMLSSGLLGRNCAVSMEALQKSGGFDAEAKSGTDYTLARQLIDKGYEIYNEKHSMVETDYPDTVELYYYKRSRWLRNTLILGYQKKDYGSMLPSVLSSLIGVFMLLTPVVAIVTGPVLLAVWMVLLVHASLSRLRYVMLHIASLPISTLDVWVVGMLSLPLDFYIAATTLIQAAVPRWRSLWR